MTRNERLGIVVLAGLAGFFLLQNTASAKTGSPDFDGPQDAGRPGSGPGGSPMPAPGGRLWGNAGPDADYRVPPGFDPFRGLWISPDCELVVEAPGFWCGITRASVDDPTPVPAVTRGLCDVTASGPTLGEIWQASPTAGAVGHAEYWFQNSATPQEIAMRIVGEMAPLCGEDPAAWSKALQDWFNAHVQRLVDYFGAELELEGG